jgi:acyl-coenzyme A thioesterase PaaI-like protein
MDQSTYTQDNYCFACGKDNPIGLKLRFEDTEEGVHGTITLAKEYQGWPGIAHGGIICAMLDETLFYTVNKKYPQASVTAELNVRMKHPVPVGEPLELDGKFVLQKGRLIQAVAIVSTRDGKALAEGQGKFIIVKPDQKSEP